MKVAIAVDWLLDQILNHQPKKSEDVSDWARGLSVKLREKGVTVPAFYCTLLKKLRRADTASAPEDAPASAPGDAPEDAPASAPASAPAPAQK
eukprot:754779-Lingulodinium_polyedra.AAC.1